MGKKVNELFMLRSIAHPECDLRACLGWMDLLLEVHYILIDIQNRT